MYPLVYILQAFLFQFLCWQKVISFCLHSQSLSPLKYAHKAHNPTKIAT